MYRINNHTEANLRENMEEVSILSMLTDVMLAGDVASESGRSLVLEVSICRPRGLSLQQHGISRMASQDIGVKQDLPGRETARRG
jgi:hypothetical protein